MSGASLCSHGNPPGCKQCAAMGPTRNEVDSPLTPQTEPQSTLPADRVPAFRPSNPDEEILPAPPALPDYEIQELLGRGGVGIVYKAWHRQLKRSVALKMLRAGALASKRSALRFRFEAEAVASLSHPNIVQIHEVGEHEGMLYFALEFVDGGNLDDVAATKSFAPQEAALLVETLARAVGYAHQHGVIHRDLKPANVLLTRDHVPKITDFGLAKKVDDDSGHTQDGAVVGTPSYMAPEQALGHIREIGPATDVYALGTILYELLAGAPAFCGATTNETLHQVVYDEPAPLRRHNPKVPRDLEIITFKCLKKAPNDRYASAIHLADDLHRWLTGEPIRARPTGVLERAIKWARRRPAPATLLGVCVAALLLLTGGGILYAVRVGAERDRAEANLEMAMRAVDDMLTEVGEEQLAYEPRMEEKRRRLLKKAQVLYQEFLEQRRDSPRVRLQTALASRHVADIYRLLGEYHDAEEAYDDAIHRFGDLRKSDANDKSLQRQLATCWNYLGEARRHLGDTSGAEEAYRASIGMFQGLTTPEPDDASLQRDCAMVHVNLGILRSEQANWKEADLQLRQAVEQLEGLVGQHPGERTNRQYLARAQLNRGPVLRRLSNPAEAESTYTAAIEILRELHREVPEHPEYRQELGVALNNIGNLHGAQQRYEQARAAHEEAVVLFRQLAADYPKVPIFRQELANSFNSLGAIRASEKDLDAASEQWKHAVSILDQLAKENPSVPGYVADRARLLGNLGWAAAEQKQLLRARDYYRQAAEGVEPIATKHQENPQYRTVLRDQYQNLAETEVQLGDYQAARQAALALADVFRDVPKDRFYASCFVARCIPLIRGDTHIDDATRATLEKEWRGDTLVLLRAAIDRGFKDPAELKKQRDEAFRCFAGDEAFQALLK